MLRRALLLGLVLCGLAQAGAQPASEGRGAAPPVELTAAAAWKGWARPGRATELDVRLASAAAARVELVLRAGRQTLRSTVDLQPGRVTRLHLPLPAGDGARLSLEASGGALVTREVAVSRAESPLLGAALAAEEAVDLEGFHRVALGADDLPRHAAAFAAIDALVVDAPVLAALDPRQLAALLAHAAACGRIVVVGADARVQRTLQGAGGCGGGALVFADTAATAMTRLQASLAVSLPQPVSHWSLQALARAEPASWHRVVAALAVYFAAATLTLLFFSNGTVLLLTPALAALLVLGLLQVMQPPAQLLVWSEGESGAPQARFQAWQQFPGLLRERARVAIPAQLAPSARPCDVQRPMDLEFDAVRGHMVAAEFENRLFRQVAMCYAGSFPLARALTVQDGPAGTHEVRNVGSLAWPAGRLLAAGRVHDLPPLAPGAQLNVAAQPASVSPDVVTHTALARTRADTIGALWPLDLAGVVDAPVQSRGWLLVAVPTR